MEFKRISDAELVQVSEETNLLVEVNGEVKRTSSTEHMKVEKLKNLITKFGGNSEDVQSVDEALDRLCACEVGGGSDSFEVVCTLEFIQGEPEPVRSVSKSFDEISQAMMEGKKITCTYKEIDNGETVLISHSLDCGFSEIYRNEEFLPCIAFLFSEYFGHSLGRGSLAIKFRTLSISDSIVEMSGYETVFQNMTIQSGNQFFLAGVGDELYRVHIVDGELKATLVGAK